MKNRKPKKDGGYTVPVSFKSNETSLLAYADTKGNFSQYIKKLIYDDMNKKTETQQLPMQELMIQVLVKQLLNDGVDLQNLLNKAREEGSQEVAVTKSPKKEEKKVDKKAILSIMNTSK